MKSLYASASPACSIPLDVAPSVDSPCIAPAVPESCACAACNCEARSAANLDAPDSKPACLRRLEISPT